MNWFEKQMKNAKERHMLQAVQGKQLEQAKFFKIKLEPAKKEFKRIHLAETKGAFVEPKKWRMNREGQVEVQLVPGVHVIQPSQSAPPAKTFSSGPAFMAALMRKGFTKIGSGHFSTVLAKGDSMKVIKVMNAVDQDGWAEYAIWANQNGFGGSFAPKLYSYKYVHAKHNFAVAVMERLPKVIDAVKRSEEAQLVKALSNYQIHYKNELAGTLADLVAPGIGKFLSSFSAKYREKPLDMHGENFMVRENGTLVFTDPISHVYSPQKTRLRLKQLTPSNDNLATLPLAA